MSGTAVFDVVVVGAGFAGMAAAHTARACGASVGLVAHDGGTAALGSGALFDHAETDVARASHPPPRERYADLAWLHDAGLRMPGQYVHATVGGTLVEAVSSLPSLLDLDGFDPSRHRLGVVDLDVDARWSAQFVARSLAESLGCDVRTIDAASTSRFAESMSASARLLDTEGRVDALASLLADPCAGLTHLLFAPVLGLRRPGVAERLAAKLQCTVGECCGDAGDPPARRLADRMRDFLLHGIECVRARVRIKPAETVVAGGGRVVSEQNGVDWIAGAIVLATGGLAGGGVVFDEVPIETCAGCDVWFDDESDERRALPIVSAQRGLDPVPIFEIDDAVRSRASAMGVRVDERSRIVDRGGRNARYAWLFAAGAVVAGGAGPYGPGVVEALRAGQLAGTYAAAHVGSTTAP